MSERTLTADTAASPAAAAGTAFTLRVSQAGAAAKQDVTAGIVSLLQAADGAAFDALLKTTRPCFSADKNGSAQASISPITFTKISWGRENYDVGGYFANNTWTPPAGKYRISCQAIASAGLSVAGAFIISLYRQGTRYRDIYQQGTNPATSGGGSGSVAFDSTGSETFDIYVYGNSATTITIDGSTSSTFFQGEQI